MPEEYRPTTLEIMNGIMQFHNYKDTSGVIFFKSGLALRIPAFYDFFQEEWVEYKTITSIGASREELTQYLEENNGGVVSNGMVTINLPEVVAMVREGENNSISIIKNLGQFNEEEEED